MDNLPTLRVTMPTLDFPTRSLPPSITRGIWSEKEHERFLDAMKRFPSGPWRAIAACVGTRSIKQVQTHAQKYQQKIHRRQRGLRKQKKTCTRPDHRVDIGAGGSIHRISGSGPMSASTGVSVTTSIASLVTTEQSSPRSPADLIRSPEGSTSDKSSSQNSMATCVSDIAQSMELKRMLETLEPLPFDPSASSGYSSLFDDMRYNLELQETIQLLLA